jgi:uncharacterized membrane protein YjfL (UPF0719 family)
MLDTIGKSLGFVFVLIGILFIGKVLLDLAVYLLHKRNADHELSEKDNPAFGVSFFGFLIGLAIATLSGVTPGNIGYSADIALMLMHGAFAILALLIAWVVNDKCILYNIRNIEAVFDRRNLGVGIVEAASFVATALVLSGSWSSGGWGVAALWFVIGQIMFIIVTLIYQWITPYNIHAEIAGDNTACSIAFSGFLVATGILVGKAVSGSSTQLGPDMCSALIYLVTGMVALVLIRLLIGRLFLKTAKLNKEISVDRNPNAGLAEAVIYGLTAYAFTIMS